MNHINIKYVKDKSIVICQESKELNPFTWADDKIYQENAIYFVYNKIKQFNNESTILDIGAQSGCFSLLSKFLPNTLWHSFEPDPINRDLLEKNLKINNVNNVIIHKEALSNRHGEDIFNINPKHRGLNTLGKNLKRFENKDSLKINVTLDTVDNLFLNTKIDFIKIDTEGAEYDIINGAKEVIKKYKPLIFLECEENNLLQFDITEKKLKELINNIDYKITWQEEDNIFIEPI
jgi:FkbM family methyltransferase